MVTNYRKGGGVYKKGWGGGASEVYPIRRWGGGA